MSESRTDLNPEENGDMPEASERSHDSSFSENEKTIVQKDVVADLREEIKILKMSVDALIKNSTAPILEKNDTPQLSTTTSLNVPQTTTTTFSSLSLSNQKLSIPNNLNLQYNYVSQPSPILSTREVPYQPLFVPPNSSSYFLPQPTVSFSASASNQPTASASYQQPAINHPINAPRNSFESHPQAIQPVRKLYDLPEFSGRPEQWPMFSVSFRETTLHYNYSNLENLFRLQKALKGNAKAKVEAYLIYPEGVQHVMSTLEFHYGRPDIMVRSQIAKARAFPVITARNLCEIVNFSTMVSNLTIFLENAGARPHLANPTLLEELVNKLPLAKREEWVKYSINNLGQYPSVGQFSDWLQNIATYISIAAETCENSVVDKGNRIKPSFSITVDERNGNKCTMCRNNHSLTQCSKFRNFSTTQRWKFVKDKRLCFCCLKPGHNSSQCSNRRQCNILQCKKSHNRLLHENEKFRNENKTNNDNRDEQMETAVSSAGTMGTNEHNESDSRSVTTILEDNINKRTLFKYLPVKLKGPNGAINIIAFIDEGSKISLLEQEVANKIGLKGPKTNLSLGWIGGKKSNALSMKVDLEICGMNNSNNSFHMKYLRTTDHLSLPAQSLNIEAFKSKFYKLSAVDIEGYFNATPKLLIGLPHIRLVRPYQVINLDESFSLHKTALGNILFGSNEEHVESFVCVIEPDCMDDLKQQVSDYFSLENFGMKPVNPVVSNDDLRAEKILRDTTVKVGQQYKTGLLWKSDDCVFKETYPMAYKRLCISEQKMKRDISLQEWYRNKIEEYLAKGYARKLSKEEASIKTDRTWYLPHFVVTNVNKQNKRRLVFDAAATVDGESFNSRLIKGPAKYQPNPLLAVLFKFRQGQVGVCGDIREMFHRVLIREDDQTAQRFLWRTNISDIEPEIYVMQAMIFGSASSPCSAQYVKNLNASSYRKGNERAYRAIVECHYVDDFVDSFDTPDDAISVTESVIRIHNEAGFELRDLVSNSVEFCDAFRDLGNDNGTELKNLGIDEVTTEKVLGLYWMPNDDTFNFILKFSKVAEPVLKTQRKPTKREVLSLVMSIFDPFGFLANFVIRSKLLLQELWSYDIGWSSPLPDEVYKKWLEWYSEIENVKGMKINRCYHKFFTASSTLIDLHIFVDASEVAFAAVAFWRMKMGIGVELVFVAGKCKCAPLKPLSIPRLELLAAVLGIRLKEAIVSSHDVKPRQILLWSDSKTVIKWIQSDCRIYKQFVSHRIAEILEHSQVNQWRWVPGSQNPADDATRPRYFSGNARDSKWLNGPNFLKLEESEWPKLDSQPKKPLCDPEVRAKFVLSVIEENPLISFENISNYYKLLRIQCWVDRAIRIFMCSAKHHNRSSLNFKPYLTAQEIRNAEIYWCKQTQRDAFSEEYAELKSGLSIPKKSSIYKLNPFLADDGLMRISGRLSKATFLERNTREPIIMPKTHWITKLIVRHYHEAFFHQNQEAICAAIRTKFWIPCLRQLVRGAKKLCQLCKNRSAVPETPLMGQLPEDRVTPFVRPFTYTGVDYLGPYTVTIGRRCEKRWVSLFTCMTTRAVHLELSKDLSADAVILCLRNFMNRRGLPIRIRSDRGTNFVGASKERLVEFETAVGDECSKRGVQWVFNTPANPSAGGAWERMVRAIKSVLAFTLKEKSPQVDTLNSLLIEAENLVNSRPLTHLPIESVDNDPITPNHFLIGGPNIIQTPAVGERICLRKQWRILQQMKQTFWKRWVLEYLPELTRRSKWFQPVKPLRIGDVVIICDDNEERGKWKRGVVEEIFEAADGQVRSAIIKTAMGSLRRPASKLAVLDLVGESSGNTHGRWDVMN